MGAAQRRRANRFAREFIAWCEARRQRAAKLGTVPAVMLVAPRPSGYDDWATSYPSFFRRAGRRG